jgi:hypothetical protein
VRCDERETTERAHHKRWRRPFRSARMLRMANLSGRDGSTT